MKNSIKVLTGTLLSIAVHHAAADTIGGGPKADFSARELSVPCVQVTNLSDATEGTYYDIVLSQRGNSFNYEITLAEVEDSTVCERIAEFAKFEDDDYDDSDDDSDDDSSEDVDDDLGIIDNSAADILAQCESRTDRAKVSVKGKDLMSGSYYVSLTSGSNTAQSTVKSISDNEFEIDFDSDADDVLEGAEEIEASFITDGSVIASIFLDGDATPVVTSTVSCRVR
jgi:hypothetical protein